MNTSSDAAETVARISIQGTEVALKASGQAASRIIIALIAALKNKKQTMGKTTLTNLLKSGKPLKVFSVKSEDLDTFVKEAKRYGVLYSVLKNKDYKDGIVDIMVRAEDAPKINRIVERFKLTKYDINEIVNEINKDNSNKTKEHDIKIDDDIVVSILGDDKEKIVDEILNTNDIPKQQEGPNQSDPSLAKTEKSPLSEPSYETKNISVEGAKPKKPSVKEKLNNIKKDLEKTRNKKNNTKSKQENKKQKNKKKTKERGR